MRFKCKYCKYYKKITLTDIVFLTIKSESLNYINMNNELRKFCKKNKVVNKDGCIWFEKKWYAFWIKGD